MRSRGPYGFWEISRSVPDTVAVVDVAGREWSAGEMLSRCRQMAGWMKARGLSPGDVVVAALPDSAFLLQLALTALESGLYFAPLDPALTQAEMEFIKTDSRAALFLDQSAVGGLLEELESFSEPRAGEGVAGSLLFYTSGTSGRPAAVLKPLANSAPEQLGKLAAVHLNAVCGIRPRSGCVHLVASPLYHSASLLWCLDHLHLGHQIVLAGSWDSERFLSLVERYGVTGSLMVPTHFYRLLQLPEESRQRYSTASLRHVVHTGSACPVTVKRRMMSWWGPVIYEVYGAAEGGGTRVRPEEWLAKPGTVGAGFGRIRILDEQGLECPPGIVGRVFIKLGSTAFSYLNARDKTENNRRDGFFTVGDLGYLDEDGYLFLQGRESHLIVTGGVNVYPAEVEAVLGSHPSVSDILVLGVADEEFGERVKAVVEPVSPDKTEGLEKVLRELAERELAPVKRPRLYEMVECLARNDAGKVTHQARAKYSQMST